MNNLTSDEREVLEAVRDWLDDYEPQSFTARRVSPSKDTARRRDRDAVAWRIVPYSVRDIFRARLSPATCKRYQRAVEQLGKKELLESWYYHGGKRRTHVGLTPAGCEALGIDPADYATNVPEWVRT